MDRILLALLLTAGLFLRFYHLSTPSIWLDEDNQARVAVRHNPENIWNTAAAQQQPPLDYYFSAASLKTFGFNEFGLRFPAALLGSFAPVLLFMLLRRLQFQHSVSFCAAAILTVQPWFISYSQEGRPIMAGIFFSLVYFYALRAALEQPGDLKRLAGLLLSILLFLHTVTYHPVVVIAATSLCVVLALGKDLGWRGLLRLAVAHALAALLFLPTFLNVLDHSRGQQSRNGASPLNWGRFREVFDNYEWITDHVTLIYFAIAALALVAAVHRPHDKPRFERLWTLLALVFPLLYTLGFVVFIRREPFAARYLLMHIPMLLIAWALLMERLKRRMPATALIVMGCFVFATSLQFYRSAPKLYAHKILGVADWRAVFDYFRSHPEQNGVAYYFSGNPPGEWAPDGLIATEFYYRDPTHRRVRAISQWDHWNIRSQVDTIARDLDSGLEPRDIYLVASRWWNTLPLAPLHFETLQFYGVEMIHLKNEKNFAQTLEDFFAAQDRALPDVLAKYKIIEMRLVLALNAHNTQAAEEHYRRLQQLIETANPDSPLLKTYADKLLAARL